MFRLIHISDLHLGPLPAARIRDLASKRILGYVNWRRNRSRAFGDDIEAALIAAIPSAARRKRAFQPLKGELPSPLAPPPGCPFHPRCEQAMSVCREVRPVLTEVAPGRSAACHLHTSIGPKSGIHFSEKSDAVPIE